jgi:hypothetical protein
LSKILEESDDSLGKLETTKSTTKAVTTSTSSTTTTAQPFSTKRITTTTKSTALQRSTKRFYAPSISPDDEKTTKTFFSKSFYHNIYSNNPTGPTDSPSKSLMQITTQKSQNNDLKTSTPATTKSTLINPFYYGFNRLPHYNSNTTKTSTQKSTFSRNLHFTTTARTPYSFLYFTTSTKKDLISASTPSTIEEDVDNNFFENPKLLHEETETEKYKPSTYNPVFDIYFKQIGRQRTSSTKSQ